MKKLLKILAYLLGLILVLALIFFLYINFSSLPTYENKAPDLKVESDSLKVLEGQKIVKTLCSACHRGDDGRLSGREMIDASAFGEIHASNITYHPEHGALAKYTDGELAYLIRTGIKKDGSYAPPWMVKLPHLSDYDMEAIISYLRSNPPELAPSDNPTKESKLNFLAKMLIKLGAFKPMKYPEEKIEGPDKNNLAEYGEYLAVSKYDCFACHSATFKDCDFENPKNSKGFFGGGNPIPDMDGNVILSANLTMDKETGLGNWTEEDFIAAVKSGKRPNKISNRYPMLPYPLLEDTEVSAIWAYLQTVPVIKNENDFTPDFKE